MRGRKARIADASADMGINMERKTAMDNWPVVAGIDVGKWQLHVHVLPVDEAKAFVNDEAGVSELSDWLRGHKVDLVVLEPTGRHHRLAHNRLTVDGLAVTLVNPDRSRQFAKATGKLAKTDSVDARLLAELGQVLAPEVVDPSPPEQLALKDLLMVRSKITEHKASLKIMAHDCRHAEAAQLLDSTIADLDRRIVELDSAIQAYIRTSAELVRRDRILRSIPGIGPITSATLCATMPELGAIGPRKAASLCGLAPFNDDSGKRFGPRHIKGGRFAPRRILYMAATTAIQRNPDMRRTYELLIAKGKEHKVALVAVMRKLVVLADALLRADRTWTASPPPLRRPVSP